eukprot:423015_1
MSLQLDTNEGVGEAEDLDVWLKQNKLMKARPKLIENDATLSELKELADESSISELKTYAQKELGLDLLTAKRFAKSVAALTSNQKPSPSKPAVIRIVLTIEEETAINTIHKRQQGIKQKIDKAANNMNILKKLSKTNENEVNEFRKQAIVQFNQRMDAIITKSNVEIKKKEQIISSYINKLKAYNKSLGDANSQCENLLNDTQMDKTKRKIKIVNISKDAIKIEIKQLNITPKVKVEIDRNEVMKYLNNIGIVNNYYFPDKPNIVINNITETTATVRFNNIKPSYACMIELSEDYKVDDDEKKVDHKWKEVCLVKNENSYNLISLKDDKDYGIRVKYKNEHGFGELCDAVIFKTKKIEIQSSILTKTEIGLFFSLLSKNGKTLGKTWNLIYRATKDGLNRDAFVNKVHGKANVICFIHAEGNVFGVYSSTGWERGKINEYTQDHSAFLFGIRSSKNYAPIISNINRDDPHEEKALGYHSTYYLAVGYSYVFYLGNGTVGQNDQNDTYDPFTNKHHFLGGKSSAKVTDVEVFQIK